MSDQGLTTLPVRSPRSAPGAEQNRSTNVGRIRIGSNAYVGPNAQEDSPTPLAARLPREWVKFRLTIFREEIWYAIRTDVTACQIKERLLNNQGVNAQDRGYIARFTEQVVAELKMSLLNDVTAIAAQTNLSELDLIHTLSVMARQVDRAVKGIPLSFFGD